MPEIPDLSKFKGDPSKDGAKDDGKVHLSAEERATMDDMIKAELASNGGAPPEPEVPTAIEVVTAYVTVLLTDGSIKVAQYDGTAFALQRPFGNVDVIASSAFIHDDLVSNLTAVKTQQGILALGQQHAEQAARTQIAQQIQSRPHGYGGFPPGR
jgi:hypothetical protein